jgi:hypothetical protein
VEIVQPFEVTGVGVGSVGELVDPDPLGTVIAVPSPDELPEDPLDLVVVVVGLLFDDPLGVVVVVVAARAVVVVDARVVVVVERVVVLVVLVELPRTVVVVLLFPFPPLLPDCGDVVVVALLPARTVVDVVELVVTTGVVVVVTPEPMVVVVMVAFAPGAEVEVEVDVVVLGAALLKSTLKYTAEPFMRGVPFVSVT